MPNGLNAQLTRPLVGESRLVFHSSAAATGVTRNGVISRVRTTPRPKNFRSSSRAKISPSTTEMMTVPTISRMVLRVTVQNWLSPNTST